MSKLGRRMSRSRGGAWVTGVGLVTPAGAGAADTWSHIVHNNTCSLYIDYKPSVTNYRSSHHTNTLSLLKERQWCAAAAGGYAPPAGVVSADRMTHFAAVAAEEAAGRAGLRPDEVRGGRADRCRVSIGSSKGGVITFGEALDQLASASVKGNGAAVFGRLLQEFPPDAAARRVAERFGITGGAHATVAACATGALALVRAAQWIEEDEADIVLAGSSDASIAPLWLAAFDRMGVQARAHPTLGPAFACRPFDRTREGFIVGEGAAVLVLESERSVRRRGVEPLARLAGYAAGSDPAGLTGLAPDAGPLAEVIRRAVARAGIEPRQIAAIQAHGTATPINDRVEVEAIREVQGGCTSSVPVVSFKGAIGHLLGAAGSVETALAVLAIRHGVCPGNATLLEPDPDLGPLVLPRGAFDLAPGPILKISMGFGGHLAALVVVPP